MFAVHAHILLLLSLISNLKEKNREKSKVLFSRASSCVTGEHGIGVP